MTALFLGSCVLAVVDMFVTLDGKKLGLSEERKLLVWRYGPRTGAIVQIVAAGGLAFLTVRNVPGAALGQFFLWAAQMVVTGRNLSTLRERRADLKKKADGQ